MVRIVGRDVIWGGDMGAFALLLIFEKERMEQENEEEDSRCQPSQPHIIHFVRFMYIPGLP